jgi:uncharacterized membrane protein
MATYIELRQLFGNGDLLNRIEVACIVAAETIQTEDAATVNHANRVLWAASVFSQSRPWAEKMLMALLAANRAATVQDITGATDETLQTLVNNTVNLFATGS